VIENRRIEWQRHALERMFERDISRQDVFHVLLTGEEIEDYSDDKPFPSALLFGWKGNEPIHVVVALDSIGQQGYIITVYRPDLEHFNPDFRTRRNR
jgi:hypothetical protein